MLLFRKIWINGREPKDEYWEIAEVWKIWLMTAHQKHWGRRHWSANVNCLVIRKKRINPFSCNLWEEWLIGSWNGGREIGIRLNKAQKDWKSMPRKYIQFQAMQLKKKKRRMKKAKKCPWFDATDPNYVWVIIGENCTFVLTSVKSLWFHTDEPERRNWLKMAKNS